jgi:hypothetical protein
MFCVLIFYLWTYLWTVGRSVLKFLMEAECFILSATERRSLYSRRLGWAVSGSLGCPIAIFLSDLHQSLAKVSVPHISSNNYKSSKTILLHNSYRSFISLKSLLQALEYLIHSA